MKLNFLRPDGEQLIANNRHNKQSISFHRPLSALFALSGFTINMAMVALIAVHWASNVETKP